ncbi:MAG: lipocalin family protein [Chitinophagaceae bacterium]|nr:lipocalin family protein [Chitinophagaceae bacterium]
MNRIIFFGLSILTAGLFSCKKETAGATDPFTLLTKDVWIITANTYQKDSDASTTDYFTGMPDCSKDDEYQFLTDGKYYQTNGATPCPGEAAILVTGSWQLSANEKSIFLTTGGTTEQYEIVELTQNKLVTRLRMDRGSLTSTYTH